MARWCNVFGLVAISAVAGILAGEFVVAGEKDGQPGRFQTVDLFAAGDNGYALYRIPGIVATARGTLLAYCEARKTAGGDWGTIDVFLRRSTDGGRTWEPARKIVTPPRDAAPNPVALAQKLDQPGEVTVNNPVAIAAKNGTVHFLYCLEYARCFWMKSGDDGRTFSDAVEITAAFEGFRSHYDWKVLATGPGHGIELQNGRLVVPVWLSTGTGGHAHRPSSVSVIYSDDRGRTWQAGDIVVRDPEPKNPSETAVVELADGRVMLNIRNESPEHRRAVSISPDGATEWGGFHFDDELPEPVCMGGIVRLARQPESDRNRLLFANPHNSEDRKRCNLTVKLSYDEGDSWPVARTIEPGISGYCDLAVGSDQAIYCFFERGSVDENHYRPAALALAALDVEWLTDGKDRLDVPETRQTPAR